MTERKINLHYAYAVQAVPKLGAMFFRPSFKSV